MKKFILFDDGNAIAKSIERLCIKEKLELEVYRDKVNNFSIGEFLKSPQDFIKSLKFKKYDGIIIAPMYFEYDENNFQKLIDINLRFPEILMSSALDIIKDNGVILNLISTDFSWGSYKSKYYSSVMAAKVSLTKSYANLFGPHGIRVNSVAAGWIESIIEDNMDATELAEKIAIGMASKAKEMTPLGRKGTPLEIAQVFLFLLSEYSSFINGQTINVDGGYGNVDSMTKCEYELGLGN